MLLIAVVTLLLCLCPVGAQRSAVIPSLPSFLDAMIVDYYKPTITIGMGSFTYANTEIPTPFSRWLEDELRYALTRTSSIKLFDKRVAAAMNPSIKENYENFFGSEYVDALLYGRYTTDGPSVQVTISMTDLANGQLIAERKFLVSSTQFPSGMRIEPTIQTLQTVTSLETLATGTAPSDPGFKVAMSTDRGLGATYRTGENLVLLVACSRDAYLKIYHVNVNGVAQLIWPNRFGGSGKISKGEALRFPAQGDRFMFKLGAPYGTEYIKAIASTTPFKTMEPDFSDLEGSVVVAIGRGLSVGSNTENRAEALVVYEILP